MGQLKKATITSAWLGMKMEDKANEKESNPVSFGSGKKLLFLQNQP